MGWQLPKGCRNKCVLMLIIRSFPYHAKALKTFLIDFQKHFWWYISKLNSPLLNHIKFKHKSDNNIHYNNFFMFRVINLRNNIVEKIHFSHSSFYFEYVWNSVRISSIIYCFGKYASFLCSRGRFDVIFLSQTLIILKIHLDF